MNNLLYDFLNHFWDFCWRPFGRVVCARGLMSDAPEFKSWFPHFISYPTSICSPVKWGIITIPIWWVVMRIKWDWWHMVSFLLMMISFLKGCALPLCWGVGVLLCQWVATLHSGITWGAFGGLSLGHVQTVTSEPLGLGQWHQSFVKCPRDCREEPQLRFTISFTPKEYAIWEPKLRFKSWPACLARWPWANA